MFVITVTIIEITFAMGFILNNYMFINIPGKVVFNIIRNEDQKRRIYTRNNKII